MQKYEGPIVVDVDPTDGIDVEYTVKGEFPETGFIIESPSQPRTPAQPFIITVVSSERSF